MEQKEAFRIVGISKSLEKEIDKNFEIVPSMCGKAAQDGMLEKLTGMMNNRPMGMLGVINAMMWKNGAPLSLFPQSTKRRL